MKHSIIIVGAGGHAKVCIELLQAMGETVAFCIGGADSTDQCLQIPVLKGDEHLTSLRSEGYYRVFIAIGANHLRERLANLAMGQGYQLVNAISPQAVVSATAKLGMGIAIMPGAIINAETVLGDLAIVNTGATVDHDCRIGKAAHVAPQCVLAGNVSVGEQSFLGIGCKVIPEVNIAEQVTVGAGAVVITDIPPYAKAVGVPAKIINSTL